MGVMMDAIWDWVKDYGPALSGLGTVTFVGFLWWHRKEERDVEMRRISPWWTLRFTAKGRIVRRLLKECTNREWVHHQFGDGDRRHDVLIPLGDAVDFQRILYSPRKEDRVIRYNMVVENALHFLTSRKLMKKQKVGSIGVWDRIIGGKQEYGDGWSRTSGGKLVQEPRVVISKYTFTEDADFYIRRAKGEIPDRMQGILDYKASGMLDENVWGTGNSVAWLWYQPQPGGDPKSHVAIRESTLTNYEFVRRMVIEAARWFIFSSDRPESEYDRSDRPDFDHLDVMYQPHSYNCKAKFIDQSAHLVISRRVASDIVLGKVDVIDDYTSRFEKEVKFIEDSIRVHKRMCERCREVAPDR